MSRKLVILFAPIDCVGPVNSSIGIAEVLKNRGHRIVFAVSNNWKGKLNIYGFEEELIEDSKIKDPAKYWPELVFKSGLLRPGSHIDKMKRLVGTYWQGIMSQVQTFDPKFKEIIDRIKPDVILTHTFFWTPAIMNSGIPWVWTMTCNPLCIDFAFDDERLPPSCSGLPTNGDKNEWTKFREEKDQSIGETWSKFNDWIVSKGFPSLPKNKLMTPSPYLNIYPYPEELDYTDIRQLPSHWHRFDYFKRSGNLDSFEIPEKLKNRTGKLIYLSMGSMGNGDIEFMKRFVSMLSKSEHRFIVSKGQFHDQYELADNMWGDRTVPQIKVLPIVDLVITHGGNNTITETLFFGKPMIVIPLWLDQFDNAQRIQEKGLGIRLDPYECTETELLESIESVLNNQNIALKLEKFSKRIQSSNGISTVTQLIEDLVK